MSTQKKEAFWTKVRPFETQRLFIVFSVIYFPVAVLFLNRGMFSEVILLGYTLVMFMLGVLMLARFLIYLSKSANEHKGNYGSLLIVYVFNVLIPFIMFKVFGYTILRMLPRTHSGFVCDIKYFVVDMFALFKYQETLTFIIMASAILFGAFAVWAVGKK